MLSPPKVGMRMRSLKILSTTVPALDNSAKLPAPGLGGPENHTQSSAFEVLPRGRNLNPDCVPVERISPCTCNRCSGDGVPIPTLLLPTSIQKAFCVIASLKI